MFKIIIGKNKLQALEEFTISEKGLMVILGNEWLYILIDLWLITEKLHIMKPFLLLLHHM